jgi:putative ABC transport system substrate-binding protein
MSAFDPKRTWGVTNGAIPNPKCDIVFIPDVVLGAGEAMRRREFIAFVGSTAAAWARTARAQQPARPVVGFLRDTSLADAAHLVTGFRNGLEEASFVEGQNVVVEYRSANDQLERLPVLVADLIGRQAAVIVGNTNAALAAKAVTTTVPIVFASGSDPVTDGLVASLNRPGGNVTGVTFLSSELGAKRLDLVRELVPKASTIAMLVNPNSPEAVRERQAVQAAAQSISQQLIVLDVNSEQEIDAAFATFVQRGAGALLCGSGAFLNSHRDRVVALAARYALPTIYVLREYVSAGGLMSYGTSIVEAYRRVGIYAGRILKGERPTDLPVIQSTKFSLLINLKTAKALGLEIPAKLLALADEVIE